jgi:hypothetical protein
VKQVKELLGQQESGTSRQSDLGGLQESLVSVFRNVEKLEKMVDGLDSANAEDFRIKGRSITEAISSLPLLTPDLLRKVLNANDLESIRKVVEVSERQMKISLALQSIM